MHNNKEVVTEDEERYIVESSLGLFARRDSHIFSLFFLHRVLIGS